LPAALRTAQGEHRHAGRSEGFHVAVDGALRHFEPLGEHTRRQAAMRLEEENGGEQTVGSHRRNRAPLIMTERVMYVPAPWPGSPRTDRGHLLPERGAGYGDCNASDIHFD